MNIRKEFHYSKYCTRPSILKFHEIMTSRNVERLFKKLYFYSKKQWHLHSSITLSVSCLYICIYLCHHFFPFSLLFFFWYTCPPLTPRYYVLYLIYYLCVVGENKWTWNLNWWKKYLANFDSRLVNWCIK